MAETYINIGDTKYVLTLTLSAKSEPPKLWKIRELLDANRVINLKVYNNKMKLNTGKSNYHQ